MPLFTSLHWKTVKTYHVFLINIAIPEKKQLSMALVLHSKMLFVFKIHIVWNPKNHNKLVKIDMPT